MRMRVIGLMILISVVMCSIAYAGKVQYNFYIQGTSMMPALEPGYHKVETVDLNNIKVGDVVCFNYDKRHYVMNHVRYICHRIVYLESNYVCTKGDNNNVYDPCVFRRDLALKVIV